MSEATPLFWLRNCCFFCLWGTWNIMHFFIKMFPITKPVTSSSLKLGTFVVVIVSTTSCQKSVVIFDFRRIFISIFQEMSHFLYNCSFPILFSHIFVIIGSFPIFVENDIFGVIEKSVVVFDFGWNSVHTKSSTERDITF